MSQESEQILQFKSAIMRACVAAEKVFSSHKDVLKTACEYRTHIKDVIKRVSVQYEQIEQECIKILSNAIKAFDGIQDVKARLQGLSLECEMPTSDRHEFRIWHIGSMLYYEASFDNGYSVYLEQIGPVLSGVNGTDFKFHFVDAVSNEVLPRKDILITKDFLIEQIVTKVEWFLSGVGQRIPIYRLASDEHNTKKKGYKE